MVGGTRVEESPCSPYRPGFALVQYAGVAPALVLRVLSLEGAPTLVRALSTVIVAVSRRPV